MMRLIASSVLLTIGTVLMAAEPVRSTKVTIDGDKFYIKGRPTYNGRTWNGNSIEGLLFDSRMVQAIFDDRNPDTQGKRAYPDTKTWDLTRARERLGYAPRDDVHSPSPSLK